jgi:2-isopropylmalate synthase
MQKQVEIYDTTLRDGAQREGITYSVKDKLNIAKKLDEFGIHYIEGGWPGSNPKDIEFFKEIKKVKLENAKIAAFGATRKANIAPEEDANLRELVNSGAPIATIFGKSWDFHVITALKTTLDENLRMISDSIKFLRENGMRVFYDAEHFFDGYKANPEYAMKTLKAAEKAGAEVIIPCDTNGGALTFELEEIFKKVKEEIKTPLGIHAHNDSELAVSNSIAAVKLGAVQVQGTINGYGERCGNANLCSVIPNLQLKLGIKCIPAENLKKLTELSHYVSEVANLAPDTHQPFVGKSAFSHKGGVHADAVRKDTRTYEHIDPELVGNKRKILISELSGKSSVYYKIEQMMISEKVDARELLDTVKMLEKNGYHFEAADASFELLTLKMLGKYKKPFELEGFRVIVDQRKSEVAAEATVKIKVGNQHILTAGEGNGPVNALDAALRRALAQAYPIIEKIKLVDYKVRVLDETEGTAAKVRVLIESAMGDKRWGTIGVSTNIIEASYHALTDSIEYALLKFGKE